MIKANELRIGNWVAIGVHKCEVNSIHVVPGIQESHVRVSGYVSSDPAYCVYTHQIGPIPLTPEILEKHGFKKSAEFDIWYALDGHLSLQLDSCFWWSIDDVGDNEGSHNRKILYLHQLQNLYFALTGTELEVKL